jgi:Fur family peroxide stress response transcriptional regulator
MSNVGDTIRDEISDAKGLFEQYNSKTLQIGGFNYCAHYYSWASGALTGQTSAQDPQSVHVSGSIIYLSSPSLMASAGHSSAHRPQEMLTRVGLVLDLGAPEERRRFDGNTSDHSHFFCTNCGKIEDMVVPGVEKVMNKVKQDTSRQIDRCRLDFFGQCAVCQSENNNHSDKQRPD